MAMDTLTGSDSSALMELLIRAAMDLLSSWTFLCAIRRRDHSDTNVDSTKLSITIAKASLVTFRLFIVRHPSWLSLSDTLHRTHE